MRWGENIIISFLSKLLQNILQTNEIILKFIVISCKDKTSLRFNLRANTTLEFSGWLLLTQTPQDQHEMIHGASIIYIKLSSIFSLAMGTRRSEGHGIDFLFKMVPTKKFTIGSHEKALGGYSCSPGWFQQFFYLILPQVNVDSSSKQGL